MAITQLNSTTLSEALSTEKTLFTVASTSNISAGDILVVGTEAMRVNSIPVSGTVSVTRGVDGSLARMHVNGKKVYIGSPDKFKNYRDHARGLFGDSRYLPEYLIPGSRARDGLGNEYVLVDITATGGIPAQATVLISPDGEFGASLPVTGVKGSCGVLAEGGTSTQYAWAQIYGYCLAQDTVADSAGTSAVLPVIVTTASTPSVGMAVQAASSTAPELIHGMFIVGAASTATTSATSHTGVAYPVWLNYPFVDGLQDFVVATT